MTTTTGHEERITMSVVGPPTSLLMAMELGKYEWKVGFTTGLGQRPRRRTIRTDHWQRLPEEITAAKQRLGVPAAAPVTSCHEAGPDGFWCIGGMDSRSRPRFAHVWSTNGRSSSS